tara:strand:+ start:2895 stop:3185 length:291 start_codon:yes stop_codon:yes gene_type:complete
MVKLVSITRTAGQKKEFKAIFLQSNGKEKTVRFGTSSNYVLNSKKTPQDRLAYLARHKVNENWNDPMSPGSLSRYILWETRQLKTNISRFKKRFKL